MRSGSTGRLRSAICTERSSLSRSNGTRRPLRLMTTSSRSCTRSNVVKRKLHDRHTRRRRMTEESSVGRESLTCVSRLPQFGQRMAPIPWNLRDQQKRIASSEWRIASAALLYSLFATHYSLFALTVDREPGDELLHLLAHRGFDQRIFLDALLRQHVEHLDDQLAHLLELGDAEAAGGAGGRAEPHARGDSRLFRVERDAVLVAGDV